MTYEKVKETLEKQLQLLSERSESVYDGTELRELTDAMCQVVVLASELTRDDINDVRSRWLGGAT